MSGVVTWIKVNWLLLLILALMASAFFLLRSQPSDVKSLDALDGILAGGRPTVVTFYSNF
jgi:hypothetical protein